MKIRFRAAGGALVLPALAEFMVILDASIVNRSHPYLVGTITNGLQGAASPHPALGGAGLTCG